MRIAALSESAVPSSSTSVGICPSGLAVSSAAYASFCAHDAVSTMSNGWRATMSAASTHADPDPVLPYSVYIERSGFIERDSSWHPLRHPALRFLDRYVLAMRGDRPYVAERVDERTD